MKGKRILTTGLATALLLSLLAGLAGAQEPQGTPLGTAFTYQAQLKSNGSPYTGACDLKFALCDALSGGTQIGSTQTRTNAVLDGGFFTVQLDYGTGRFQGDARWLDIQVRCPAGGGSFTPLTASPYALALLGLWTQQSATSPSLIGGYSSNWVQAGADGAAIGGGGLGWLFGADRQSPGARPDDQDGSAVPYPIERVLCVNDACEGERAT